MTPEQTLEVCAEALDAVTRGILNGAVSIDRALCEVETCRDTIRDVVQRLRSRRIDAIWNMAYCTGYYAAQRRRLFNDPAKRAAVLERIVTHADAVAASVAEATGGNDAGS